MIKISPSILSADFSKLGEEIKKAEAGGADYIHLDIMDGKFVPNISFGPPVIKKIRHVTKLPFDVHLMINEPNRYIEEFVNAGADIITVHAEACTHLHRTIQKVKSYNIKASVALNPSTSLESIKYVLNDVDMVLIMTVNPGFGGQSLIDTMESKITKLKEIIDNNGFNVDIQVDGGIKLKNIKKVMNWGANVFVAGSAIFKSDEPKIAVESFKQILKV